MSTSRLSALLWKEAQDLLRTRAAVMPAVLMLLTLALPFGIAIGIPLVTGDTMVDDSDVVKALEVARRYWPAVTRLSPEAAVQAFFFQQFLMLLVLVPVSGSMSLAAHAIIGEKQARTLEPLLATPATTTEILLAKVLAALLPALLLEAVAVLVYFGGIAALGYPGVFGALATPHTALVLLVLGPLATLIGLQIVVIASSRVNDPRTAQQFGTLVVLPLVAVLVAQGTGVFWLTVPMILFAAVVLTVVWILLALFGIAVFERERILTRWK